MLNDKYTKALAELKVILENSEDSIIKKIPKTFIMFVEENYDKDYSCKITPNISINDQNILDETKYLIALIYRSYLCSENERKEYDKILLENEINYQNEIYEKYDINVFNGKKKESEIEEKTDLYVVKKRENIFKIIINRVKKIFINWGRK